MDQSFLDPLISKDGKVYGPKRFKELVQECWYVSDNLHTSYVDVLDIAFQERLYLIELINNKQIETKKAIEAATAKTAQQ